MKTCKHVHGHIHNTFKEACMTMGLLEDHMDWMSTRSFTFANMITTMTLFVTILTFGIPNQLGNLWEQFRHRLCDDLKHRLTPFGQSQ